MYLFLNLSLPRSRIDASPNRRGDSTNPGLGQTLPFKMCRFHSKVAFLDTFWAWTSLLDWPRKLRPGLTATSFPGSFISRLGWRKSLGTRLALPRHIPPLVCVLNLAISLPYFRRMGRCCGHSIGCHRLTRSTVCRRSRYREKASSDPKSIKASCLVRIKRVSKSVV